MALMPRLFAATANLANWSGLPWINCSGSRTAKRNTPADEVASNRSYRANPGRMAGHMPGALG